MVERIHGGHLRVLLHILEWHRLLLLLVVQKWEYIPVRRKRILPLLVLLVLVLQNLLLMRKQLMVVVPVMSPVHIESLMRNIRMVVHHR
jgi:hypothetical protein